MSPEISNWIESNSVRNELDVSRISSGKAASIQLSLKGKYVDGDPRAWWMSLKAEARVGDSTTNELLTFMPTRPTCCWLIAETEEHVLPVYEVLTVHLPFLLSECPFFEYYVAPPTEEWLLAESDHNQFYVVREI